MGIRASGLLDVSQRITFAKQIQVKGVRLIIDNDDSVLRLYNDDEATFTKLIVHLDKAVPLMMFDEPYRCDNFLYAELINEGQYIIYYDV